MRNRPILAPSATACIRHTERLSVGRCDDCSAPLCRSCQIDLGDTGTFCASCASRRGGVHVGARQTYVEPEPRPVDRLDDGGKVLSSLGVQVFEAMVGDREPRTLLSGLSERLNDAGVDPSGVVDDGRLNEDISRMQALATAEREHPHRFRRR